MTRENLGEDRLGLDLMIIGAAKSGTSSVISLLHAAPGVARNPSGAELTYYLREDEFARGPCEAADKYFPRGAEGQLRVGKSAGLMYSRSGLERLATDSPNVRTVMVLRNPVERAYSAYLWARRVGVEPANFGAAIERELSGIMLDIPRSDLRQYLGRGEYARFLRWAYELFGPEAVHVVLTDDFSADPLKAANACLAPFGLATEGADEETTHVNRAARVRSPRFARFVRSPRVRTPLRKALPVRVQASLARVARSMNEVPEPPEPMDQDTRAQLVDHFTPWNAQLEKMLGKPLGWG